MSSRLTDSVLPSLLRRHRACGRGPGQGVGRPSGRRLGLAPLGLLAAVGCSSAMHDARAFGPEGAGAPSPAGSAEAGQLPAAGRPLAGGDAPTPGADTGKAPAAVLPVARTFRLLPIYDNLGAAGKLTDDQAQQQMARLAAQIGQNRAHFRVGFSHIYGGAKTLLRNAQLAKKNNLSLAVIIALQTHAIGSALSTQAASDLRSYQWRMDGVTWAGEKEKGGTEQLPSRDYKVVTPSRYAADLHALFVAQAKQQAEEIAGVMAQVPDVIVAVNGVIEEELATGAENDDRRLADYSPFAIAEFRDWLRHTGGYDASSGAYKGQGAPASLVGTANIEGAMRSPFYDDPNPADANGTGASFNETFGVNFRSWSLAYWDLDASPGPLTDLNFSPTPNSGPAFVAGGFDAPRARDPASAFWRAWSYDVADHDGAQPPGGPDAPAFGFRQHLVKHFIADILGTAVQAGIPQEIVYAHQIPGEMVNAGRSRSGADPIWTARLDASGTLGSTRFGPYDGALADRFSSNWGIFEWHPAPGAAPQSSELYDATIKALDGFFAANGYCFFPGWWSEGPGSGTFPLADSKFAAAMRDWLAGKPDVPR